MDTMTWAAFSVDVYTFSRLVRTMGYDGTWQPALDFLRDALVEQTGIRDYMDGEKVIHGFVAAHFSMVSHFLLHSEYELNKGYADLYLEPFIAQYPDMGYGYVLELKYLKRREPLDESLPSGDATGGRPAGARLSGGSRLASAATRRCSTSA